MSLFFFQKLTSDAEKRLAAQYDDYALVKAIFWVQTKNFVLSLYQVCRNWSFCIFAGSNSNNHYELCEKTHTGDADSSHNCKAGFSALQFIHTPFIFIFHNYNDIKRVCIKKPYLPKSRYGKVFFIIILIKDQNSSHSVKHRII